MKHHQIMIINKMMINKKNQNKKIENPVYNKKCKIKFNNNLRIYMKSLKKYNLF